MMIERYIGGLESWWWAIWQGSAGITTNAILVYFSILPKK
jgi:hypothetical protein